MTGVIGNLNIKYVHLKSGYEVGEQYYNNYYASEYLQLPF